MGRRAADTGRIATAINWYLQAEEVGCVSSLADDILREYAHTGRFPLEGLDSLFGAALLANERLTFIGTCTDVTLLSIITTCALHSPSSYPRSRLRSLVILGTHLQFVCIHFLMTNYVCSQVHGLPSLSGGA